MVQRTIGVYFSQKIEFFEIIFMLCREFENLPPAGFLRVVGYRGKFIIICIVKNATRCFRKIYTEFVIFYRKLPVIPVYYIKSK